MLSPLKTSHTFTLQKALIADHIEVQNDFKNVSKCIAEMQWKWFICTVIAMSFHAKSCAFGTASNTKNLPSSATNANFCGFQPQTRQMLAEDLILCCTIIWKMGSLMWFYFDLNDWLNVSNVMQWKVQSDTKQFCDMSMTRKFPTKRIFVFILWS